MYISNASTYVYTVPTHCTCFYTGTDNCHTNASYNYKILFTLIQLLHAFTQLLIIITQLLITFTSYYLRLHSYELHLQCYYLDLHS